MATRKRTLRNSVLPFGSLPDFPDATPDVMDLAGWPSYEDSLKSWWTHVRRKIADNVEASSRAIRVVEDTFESDFASVDARITTEEITRANADGSLASQITTVEANYQTADNTLSAAVITEATARASADGQIHARWGVAIDVNGNIIGRINLNGTNQSSEFAVLASKFKVWDGVSSSLSVFTGSSGAIAMSGWTINSTSLSSPVTGGGFITLDSAAGEIWAGEGAGGVNVRVTTDLLSGIASYTGENSSGQVFGLNASTTGATLSLCNSVGSQTIFLSGATGAITADSFSGSFSASDIDTGTLNAARLPSSFGGTFTGTISTTYLEAGVTTAVDVQDCNFRVYNGGTQNARIDYTDGAYYVQGNRVLSTRGSAVADASGGSTVDAEARTAINTLLARLRVTGGHGLIAD